MESGTDDQDRPRDAELSDSQSAAGLRRWVDFPASLDPRPIVCLGGPILCRGFTTGEAKGAFLMGVIDAAGDVPDEPVRYLRQGRGHRGFNVGQPLRVLRATNAEAAFPTDRGPHMLPAWRVEAEDALEPIWVLGDDARRRCWSSPSEPAEGWPHAGYPVWGAVVDGDDLGLSVDFTGGLHSLFRYELVTLESETAVVVVTIQKLVRPTEGSIFIPRRGDPHRGRVRLKQPLGARVVVNMDASPVSVTRG